MGKSKVGRVNMNTLEIEETLRHIPEFLGAFPSNELPSIKTYPSALVINIDPSWKAGSHWVACYLASKNHGQFYDPLGEKPIPSIKKFLQRNCNKIQHLAFPVQSRLVTSIACGDHCVVFICLRHADVPLDSIIRIFSRDREWNDVMALFTNKVIQCLGNFHS